MEAYVGPERVFWPLLLAQFAAAREDGAAPRLRIHGTTCARLVALAPFLRTLSATQAQAGPACVLDARAVDVEPGGCACASDCPAPTWYVAVLPPAGACAPMVARVAACGLRQRTARTVVFAPRDHGGDRALAAVLHYYCAAVREIVQSARGADAWTIRAAAPPTHFPYSATYTRLMDVSVDADGRCSVCDD